MDTLELIIWMFVTVMFSAACVVFAILSLKIAKENKGHNTFNDITHYFVGCVVCAIVTGFLAVATIITFASNYVCVA